MGRSGAEKEDRKSERELGDDKNWAAMRNPNIRFTRFRRFEEV